MSCRQANVDSESGRHLLCLFQKVFLRGADHCIAQHGWCNISPVYVINEEHVQVPEPIAVTHAGAQCEIDLTVADDVYTYAGTEHQMPVI